MKRMTSSVWGALDGVEGMACAKAESVRNIRNIQFYKKYIQLIQLVTYINLFRSHWNKPECTGTNLFRHVPAMFRPALLLEQGCSPYATRATAILQKTVFRNVPVVPEHFYRATGRVNQGLQQIAVEMFRMFRTFDSPAHAFHF